MAKPKQFEPEEAVKRAGQLFWQLGYKATTTQDLVDALGISRSSLYGTFNNKRELYLEALRRYAEDPSPKGLRNGAGSPREQLATMLSSALEEDLDPHRAKGCFAGNAALELGSRDQEVRKLVAATFASVQASLRSLVEDGITCSGVPAEIDVEAVSAGLLAGVQGLRVLAIGTRDRRLVDQALNALLDAFLGP